MERFSISKEPIHIKYSNGAELNAKRTDLAPRKMPSDTDKHEAWHATAVNGNIVMATNIPGEGYSGLTILKESSAIAAAAPHVNGCSGTGYDMSLPGAREAVSAARAATRGKEDIMLEMATEIAEKRTIDGNDAKDCIKRVEDRRIGRFPVEIQVISPEGHNSITTSITHRGEIKLEDHQLKIIRQEQLPEAA